jgi:eukaryotic-like serine/threonine-protein kinase
MKSCPACNTRYDDETTFCTRDGTPVVGDAIAGQIPSMVGQILDGRWRIIKKLGEGGMGEVYVAEHIHIEKKVAMKLLRAEVLGNAEAVSRFYTEARSASSIGHENIIPIEDFGKLPDGRVYMLMEYLVGAPLNDMIAREPLPLSRGLDIMIGVCRGLSAAHAKGITHRDMKPENVYVTQRDGRDIPKILDFGIAKVQTGDTAQNLTQAGTIYGTPFYMAPEQALGGKMDHRVDIYAMGVILYEVFCGTLPFKGETFMGILTQHITMQPDPPMHAAAQNGRQIPPELEMIILKAIRKNADERFQSMNEMAIALADVYRGYVGPRRTDMMSSVPSHMMPTMGVAVGGASGATLALSASGGVPAMTPGGMRQMTPGGMPVYSTFTPGGMQSIPQMTPGGVPAYAQPAPSRKGLLIGVVLLVSLGIGGGVGWYFVAGPGKKDAKAEPQKPDPERPVVAVTPDAAPRPVATVTPDAAPVATVLPEVKPEQKPEIKAENHAARMSTVLVETIPPRAEIVVDGKVVGVTSDNIKIPEGKRVPVELRLSGYHTKKVVVAWNQGKISERLSKKVKETNEEEEGLKTPEAFKDKGGN